MSNYPPGVTGNEYAIAGADSERDEERDVSCWNAECEFEGTITVTVSTYGSEQWMVWDCPACGRVHQEDLPDLD